MSLDITGQLGDSITNFKTFNEAISTSKQNTNASIKYLESILEKLLKLIEKAYDRTYAKIAEEKFIESKTGTAVKDKKTMHDLVIAFDDHVGHAHSIMASPANASRKKKIEEAIKQAEDVLFSMTKHQDKMKENEARFHAALPTDSKTSKNQAANHNFRTIGKEEKTMDGEKYFAKLKSMIKKFVDYSSELDKKSKAGYETAPIGLSRDEKKAWATMQRNNFAYFDDDGSRVFVKKDKTTTTISQDGKKTTVKDAKGHMIKETIIDADDNTIVTELDGCYVVSTSPDGKAVTTLYKDEDKIILFHDTIVTELDGTFFITDHLTNRTKHCNKDGNLISRPMNDKDEV